jgi:feruloyl-CoA synthase
VLDQVSSLFALPSVAAERRPDGAIILKSRVALQGADRCVGDWLETWARDTPDVIFLAERASADAPWTTLTYGEALGKVRGAAAWILAQDLSAQRPLAILSDNSIDHALLTLAAMHAGVPAAAISPAYSLMSKDFDKLKSMIALIEPGAIYVASTKQFAPALAAIAPLHDAVIVTGEAHSADALPVAVVTAARPGEAVDAAFAAISMSKPRGTLK